ncbi:MAG: superoxide dismutase family protein [Acidimicrobiia bacterium]|nr:superoxide dismutase family protein [Acidimicrobiia bacterium]
MRTSRMLATALAAVALLAAGAGAASADPSDPGSLTSADGTLVDGAGHTVGQVLAIDDGTTTLWLVFAQGLMPGLHGMQLHEVGDCGGDFADVGPRTGGAPLATLSTDSTGQTVSEFTTSSDDLGALADDDGFSVVVYDHPDNRANVPARYQSTDAVASGPDAQTVATGDVGSGIACAPMETDGGVTFDTAQRDRAAFDRRASARMKGAAATRSRARAASPSVDLLAADIVDDAGHRRGQIRFVAGPDSVTALEVQVQGLDAGAYALQLHSSGTCTGDGFSDTGPRLDDVDLPDLITTTDGLDAFGGFAGGIELATVDLPTLASLLTGDGTSVVIHTKSDNHANIPARYTATGADGPGPDATTQATGDAGVGIVCGTLRTVPPAERYIDAVYGTELNRIAEPSAIATWTAYLGRHQRSGFVAAVNDSLEGRRALVTQTYELYAGIEPDSSGLAYWSSQAARSSFNEDALISALLGSRSYYESVGGTSADFVDDQFLSLLGRDPTSGEAAIWRAYLGRGGSRSTMAAALLASPEGRAFRIEDLYLSTVDREPELPEFAIWLEYLDRGGRFRSLRISLLSSREYYDTAVSSAGLTDVFL